MFKEINVNNLFYIYDRKSNLKHTALENINVKFSTDEIISITGETGSGKSTFLKNLDALLIPTEGVINYPDDIKIDRTPIIKNGKKKIKKEKKIKQWKTIRKMIAVSFQFPDEQIFKNTVIEDVMVGPINFKMDKHEAKDNAIKALKYVNLPEEYFYKSPLKLSGGEKRKVVLASVFASNPNFIILDEPTIGLDNDSKEMIMETILKIHKSGVGIIIITHDIELAYKYTQRLIYLEKGRIIKDEKIEDVLKDDEFIKEKGLNLPEIFSCANYLEKNGYNIDYSKAKTIDGLISQLEVNHE